MDLRAESFWGGEPAADILTSFLVPGEWTIYSNTSKSDLLQSLELVPDPKSGNVCVYGPFWNNEHDGYINKNQQIVSPLLVYADLISTQNSRNFEVAKKIYEQTLSTHFTKQNNG